VSRIGRMPIPVPKGVTVDIQGGSVRVKGPKGELERTFSPDISIALEGDQVVVSRPSDSRQHRATHGLTRALLANMVTGVSEGFSRRLEIVGVGYRAENRGRDLLLSVGYSHPVVIEPPEGIEIEVEKGYRSLVVRGIEKEVVGEIAARIRRVRPPEPYKGKGIRYEGEVVRRKAGKAGKVG
jgi:large subunit ribosomal protein L6